MMLLLPMTSVNRAAVTTRHTLLIAVNPGGFFVVGNCPGQDPGAVVRKLPQPVTLSENKVKLIFDMCLHWF